MRISDWSSDVCSSDLRPVEVVAEGGPQVARIGGLRSRPQLVPLGQVDRQPLRERHAGALRVGLALPFGDVRVDALLHFADADPRKLASLRSEEHTSELQSLMRISYAVFCLKKKKKQTDIDIYYK